MDIISAILLFGAAVAGLFLLGHLSSDMPSPSMLVTAHVALAALGFVALVVYAFTTEQPQKHYHTLIILTIVGGTGLWLWISDSSILRRKSLAIAYSLLGMFAVLWLLTFIIP